MDTAHQTHVAFHLTGRRSGPGLEAVDPHGRELRPAVFARYRDLTSLRYDFPLVLADAAPAGQDVVALSALIDRLIAETAKGDDAGRVSGHLLRLEREIRTLAARASGGQLRTLWDQAAGTLGVRSDAALADSLTRARTALTIDGAVVDCQAGLPAAIVAQLWRAAQREKAEGFRESVGRLAQQLADVLRSDFVRSEAGRTPAALQVSVGTTYADLFDFGALSRTLATSGPKSTLSDRRRERIQAAIAAIERQPFFPSDGAADGWPTFVYDRCTTALDAYRKRLGAMVEVAKAIAIAELEVTGEYRDAKHDAFFQDFNADALAAEDRAVFPDELVTINAAAMDPVEQATLLEILSSGLPIKVLVQFDDLGDLAGGVGVGARARQLANMAIGLNDVFVVQAAASHLYRCRARIESAMRYAGPALLSVFSGAGPTAGMPAYLSAAAAMASRAFPALVYDPTAGSDWASRFALDDNPQPTEDWPVEALAYEDEAQQRMQQSVAFTLADFLACDPRNARHLARVPRAAWNGSLSTVAESLAAGPRARLEQVPSLLMIDAHDTLQRVIVDEKVLREARRCRDAWHSLQELGGIHNSHAERLLARERHERATRPAEAAPESAATTAAAPAATAAAVAAPAERAIGDPYIETPRCSTCNECTRVNPNMFAYNNDKQAYIKNPDAGTFRQLVEAAESCQLSIIHPGKPRNANEPDLEELIKRAEPFQ